MESLFPVSWLIPASHLALPADVLRKSHRVLFVFSCELDVGGGRGVNKDGGGVTAIHLRHVHQWTLQQQHREVTLLLCQHRQPRSRPLATGSSGCRGQRAEDVWLRTRQTAVEVESNEWQNDTDCTTRSEWPQRTMSMMWKNEKYTGKIKFQITSINNNNNKETY